MYIASCLQRTTAVPALPAAEHHKDCGSAINSNAALLHSGWRVIASGARRTLAQAIVFDGLGCPASKRFHVAEQGAVSYSFVAYPMHFPPPVLARFVRAGLGA